MRHRICRRADSRTNMNKFNIKTKAHEYYFKYKFIQARRSIYELKLPSSQSNTKTIKLNGTRKTFKYGIMFGLRPINRKLRQFGEA